MQQVQIVLFDGFDLLDAIAPYEVFCAAEFMARGTLRAEFVTAEGPRLVTSGINGVKLEATGKLDPNCGGIIIVPGASGEVFGDGPNSIPAILGRAMRTALTGQVGEALGRQNTVVATVCGGSLLLAMGGLLEGRPAVTNRLGMDVLGATGAVPVSARVVDDGNLVTAGGVTSGLDLALYLVERELGPRIAHAVEQLFEYERRGTVWREQGMAPDPPAAADETAAMHGAREDNLAEASGFDGEWDAIIATPVGKLTARLRISTSNGAIQGTATQGDEVSPFIDPELRGDKLSWSQQVTKPMRLHLKFEVAVSGDRMTGTAKAGVLPASKLTGTRVG
ncbi:DJ-1/PfpI family protein [Paenibacillus arenilitoris]|uniref:DJ-1/PfpI family protein n=1 Tax=Paenibacillus arenilitoris TaxID=2772299 RepID=A0A927CGV2_9BACL|nr:DJ-1/PfpI family protein [Paenibacillus arenilitoris]MBD2867249.1 DJ-1/PfpI family protein [Paenibacillus arenilitoris]